MGPFFVVGWIPLVSKLWPFLLLLRASLPNFDRFSFWWLPFMSKVFLFDGCVQTLIFFKVFPFDLSPSLSFQTFTNLFWKASLSVLTLKKNSKASLSLQVFVSKISKKVWESFPNFDNFLCWMASLCVQSFSLFDGFP